MSAYAVRRISEQHDASFRDRRHVESGSGGPLCGVEAEGAFVVEDHADADCVACRLLVFGPGGLN